MKIKHKTLITLLVFVIVVIVYMVFESYDIEIKKDKIISKEIPNEFDEMKIVFISDIHCSWYFGERRLKKLVEKINRLNPDIIILGGDYIYGDEKYIEVCFNALSKLNPEYGVYAVLGNHEQHGTKSKMAKKIIESGFFLIDNSSKWIDKNGERIKIGGVRDYTWDKPEIDAIVNDVKKEDFVVLVSHNPDYAEKIKVNKIDLVLSGHTHGGQFSFFRKWFPLKNSENGIKYLGGIVKNKNNIVLVSNGVGTVVFPMRFCARPQINEVILKNNKKSEPIKVR